MKAIQEIYYSTVSVWKIEKKHCIRPDDAPKHNGSFARLLVCQSKTEGMNPELESKWNKAFWARGYYVATVGNVTEDAIKKYIKEQYTEDAIKKYIKEQYDESKEEDGAAFER